MEEVPRLAKGREVQELKELQRQDMSIQAISKPTGWDRKTIRKYVQGEGVRQRWGHFFRTQHDQQLFGPLRVDQIHRRRDRAASRFSCRENAKPTYGSRQCPGRISFR